jgi:hypothetical protein
MSLTNQYGITVRADAPPDSLAAKIAASHGLTPAEAHAKGERQDHTLYHARRPSSACQWCRESYETSVASWGKNSSRCQGSRHIVYTLSIISRSPDFRATTTCIVCNRTVKATRPTLRCPWSTVGAHDAAPASAALVTQVLHA